MAFCTLVSEINNMLFRLGYLKTYDDANTLNMSWI